MAIVITITDAGRNEIINAENTGTAPVLLSEVGIGTGQYTPNAGQTALQNEIKRITTFSGDAVGDNIIHLNVTDDSDQAYIVYEFGIYTASGTLFAVYSQIGSPIINKTTASILLLAIDIALSTVNPTSLTFGDANFLNPPATTTRQGIIELATNAEVQAGTDTQRAVTPASLASRTATTSRIGLIELATQEEVDAATDALRAVTPATMRGANDARYLQKDQNLNDVPDKPQARTNLGLSAAASDPYASNAEALAGALTNRVMNPARVHDAFKQYGFGSNRAVNITTLLTPPTENILWRCAAGTPGAPTANNVFYGACIRYDNNTVIVTAFANNIDFSFFQLYNFGNPTGWRQYFHSENQFALGTTGESARNNLGVWSQSEADARYLRLVNNLSEVPNKLQARANLQLVKQTALDDTTPGALMLVGAFGLGGFARAVINANTGLNCGFYSGGGSGSVNYPEGMNFNSFINIVRTTNVNVHARIYIGDLAGEARAFIAYSSNGGINWNNQELYTFGNQMAIINSNANARNGYAYHITGNRTVTLPLGSSVAIGQKVRFTKNIADIPIIQRAGTDLIKHNNLIDTSVFFDINSEIVFVWSGTHWEV